MGIQRPRWLPKLIVLCPAISSLFGFGLARYKIQGKKEWKGARFCRSRRLRPCFDFGREEASYCEPRRSGGSRPEATLLTDGSKYPRNPFQQNRLRRINAANCPPVEMSAPIIAGPDLMKK